MILLPWIDAAGTVHAVQWVGGPHLPSVLTLCGVRNSGCRIALRFNPAGMRACDFCRRLTASATAEGEA